MKQFKKLSSIEQRVQVQPSVVPHDSRVSSLFSLLRSVGVVRLAAPLIPSSSSVVAHYGVWANVYQHLVWPGLWQDPFFADLIARAGRRLIGPKRKEAATATIERLILDLVIAAIAEELQQYRVFVLSSRRNKDLHAGTGINREAYRKAHGSLAAEGITVEYPGKQARNGHGQGFATMVAFDPAVRTHAAEIALSIFEHSAQGPTTATDRKPSPEAGKVVLKAGEGKEEKTEVIKAQDPASQELQELNKRLQELTEHKKQGTQRTRHSNEGHGRGLYCGTLEHTDITDDNSPFLNPTQEQMLYKRVFHAASLNAPPEQWYGGRLYAPFQNIPKDERPNLLLAGEPTIELDYSGHHPRLLYHLQGLELHGDPYSIPLEWPDSCAALDAKEKRTIFKKALNTALNAANLEETRGSLRKWLLDQSEDACSGRVHWFEDGKRYVALGPPRVGDEVKAAAYRAAVTQVPAILAAIEQRHGPVAHYFYQSGWKKLQTVDAQICVSVMQSMLAQGIPCLSIHDSFIVPASKKDELLKQMLEVYSVVMRELVGMPLLPVVK